MTASIASGELRGSATNARHFSNESISQRSRTNSSLTRPFGDDHVRQAVDQRDVGAGPELQVIVGLDVRRAHQVDAARIGDDQLRALAQPALHLRGEHRMPVGRIGADDHDHVGLHHRIEVLRAGRFAEGLLQAVAGRRMAHARAGVDVVVAKAGAHQLLHQVGLLVGAAARR